MRPRQAGAARGQAQDEQLPAATAHPTADHSHRLHRRHPDRKVNSIAVRTAYSRDRGLSPSLSHPCWDTACIALDIDRRTFGPRDKTNDGRENTGPPRLAMKEGNMTAGGQEQVLAGTLGSKNKAHAQ